MEEDWKNSPIYIKGDGLSIGDVVVVGTVEDRLMKEMVELFKNCDGKIVEAGYGLGMSAKYLDSCLTRINL